MKALIKTRPSHSNEQLKDYAGKWVDINTDQLFHDQYILKQPDITITDKDIVRIEDDARINKGRCKYCGKLVERGHEQEHFDERKSMKCTSDNKNKNCLYYMSYAIGQPVVTKETDPDDDSITVETTVRRYGKKCKYDENNKNACQYDMCEKLGVDWFTPKNTFFLDRPNGIPQMVIPNFNNKDWPIKSHDDIITIDYVGDMNLKSYTLSAIGRQEPDGSVIIERFQLRNNRHDYRFIYDKVNESYIELSSNSFKAKDRMINDGTQTATTVNKNLMIIMKSLFA